MAKQKIQTKWDLSHIISDTSQAGIEKSLKTYEEATNKFSTKWKNRKDYLEDPKVLKEALEDYDKWLADFGDKPAVFFYFWLLSDVKQSDPDVKIKYAKVYDAVVKATNETLFFDHRIAKIKKEDRVKLLLDPELSKYKHFLERCFDTAKYLLSESEEKILTLTSKSAYDNWIKMTQEFIGKEEVFALMEDSKRKKIPFSKISSLLMSHKKAVRDDAFKLSNEVINKHLETAEHELNSILYYKKTEDELRQIPRPDLTRHLADDIDSKIVDTLIESVSEKYNISKNFYKLKTKLFKVKKLKYHERNLSYGKTNKEYGFKETYEVVKKTLGNLDPSFEDFFVRYFEKGQVDMFPQKSKYSGGFCAHARSKDPIYILLNFDGKIEEVLALAHEFGHAINYELTRIQNPINYGNGLAVAEVASTFMEDFVFQELLKNANEKTKLTLLMKKLDEEIATIHKQVAGYKFETELHSEFRKKGYLTKEEIGKIFIRHMSAYLGPAVEATKGAENWWAIWPHIREFFYVYSYANGLLISKALQAKVKENPAFIEQVKQIFSKGLSASPYEIFKEVGIDISEKEFWLTGIKEVEDLLKETEKLAKKLKAI